MSELRTRIVHNCHGDATGQAVAVVTGAAGTMGTAIVRRLAAAGMAIALVDREGDGAVRVAVETGCTGLVIEADLLRVESAGEIMDLIAGTLGRVDHLVNNAGLNRPQNIYAIEAHDWDAVMAVNLRAPMMLAKRAIPFWEKQGGGSIVTIGSRVWLSGAIPAYTASKAGVVGLTRSFAVELSRLNVRANAVAPSYVDTCFTRMDRSDEHVAKIQANVLAITPLRRLGTAEDIANAVAFLVSSEASFITGEILHVCGGAQLASQSNPFSVAEIGCSN